MPRSVRVSLALALLLLGVAARAQPVTSSPDLPDGGSPSAGSASPSLPTTQDRALGAALLSEQIEVVGHYLNQVGTSASASAGTYT